MKNFILCLTLFITSGISFAAPPVVDLVATNYTKQSQCYAKFDISAKNLFFLTLDAINANKYNVVEMQSKGGFILFKTYNKTFLATIVALKDNNAFIKIAPADNSYYFPQSIVNNIFAYITMMQKTTIMPIEEQ